MKKLLAGIMVLGLATVLPSWAQEEEEAGEVQYNARGIIRAVVEDAEPLDDFPASGGAPVAEPEPAREVSFDVQSINFQFGSAELTMGARRQLDEFGIAATSPELQAFSLKVIGHTDDVGSAAYNQQLSEQRAGSVAAYLMDQFSIDESRIAASGEGESRPLIAEMTDDARAQNRRVELTFIVQ